MAEDRPVVWSIVGTNFKHTSRGHTGRCATHGKLPRHVEWSFEGKGAVTFYIDGHMTQGLRDGIGGVKYGWLLESRSIRPGMTEHFKEHYERYFETYRAIFTHNRELLALDDRFKFTVACGFWIQDARIHPKTKRISAISSGKETCDGHRWRNAFIERHRHELDLYGNAYRHIPRKELGLSDYMFSVAIENGSYATYFTEKVLDCFATGTVPVYHGAPDIGDFFNPDGIVVIDDRCNLAALTEDVYAAKLDAVRDNFARVRHMETAEDWMYRRYRDELPGLGG